MCDTPRLVFVPLDQPQWLVESTQRGIEYWNTLAGKDLFVWAGVADIDCDGPVGGYACVRLMNTDEEAEPSGHGSKYRRVGYCWSTFDIVGDCGSGSLVTIRAQDHTARIRALDNIVRHELGHVLGLPHVETDKAVMSRGWDGYWSNRIPYEAGAESIDLLIGMYDL